MTQYRRSRTPGSTCCFTVNLANRRSLLLLDNINAFHLHAPGTMPEDDADHALRWRLIKTRFSRTLSKTELQLESRISKRRTRHLATPLLAA